jgi:hypothetical protein
MPIDQPNLPQDLLTALLQCVQALDRLQIHYALIGGVATGYRSRPRFTQDLDFLLDVPQVVLPGLLEDLHARGFEFDMRATIREWTQEHLTTVTFHGLRIDWLKPLLPCYQRVLEEAREELLLGFRVRIADPEGLILMKLLAFRRQDQVDIESLLAANRGQLDLDRIRREWAAVASSDDPSVQRFEEMVTQFYAAPT